MLKKNEGNSYRVLRRTENIGWSGNTRSNGCCFGTCCTVLLEDIYLKVQVQVTVDDRSCSTVPRYGGVWRYCNDRGRAGRERDEEACKQMT